jgi:predicted ATPase/DNA-binding winged helix-turn-helix (wHTH) protein
MMAHFSTLSFGPFRLSKEQRLLFEGDAPVRLGGRALDLLVSLVDRPGELVTKGELMARVWPETTVEENNLKVHIAALRRALGDGKCGQRYIVTTPGRGYRFVAPVSLVDVPDNSFPSIKRRHNLPAMLTRLVGQSDTVADLAEKLKRQRFMTIVGAGGVGKTSLAMSVAETLIQHYEDGLWLAEFSSLSDDRLVLHTVAGVLGLELGSDDPLPALLAAIRGRQFLLVLDNCEHVIGTVAGLTTALHREAPNVSILATSREPLLADGEHIYRLQPLATPPPGHQGTAAAVLAYPAVQLFLERVNATLSDFELNDANANLVSTICSKLDGIPLAIEFAAARIEAFGVAGVAAGLDHRLHLLTSGCRTAPSHHRTIRTTLDWSYELLPENERRALQCLAIFSAPFSMQAACIVVGEEVSPSELIESIAKLVSKSLLSAHTGGVTVVYRLLETTRIYAREKLAQSKALRRIIRRHAEYCRDACEELASSWEGSSGGERLSSCGRLIDEVRSALEFAFSSSGDPEFGVSLVIAAVPLWFELCFLEEARRNVERAMRETNADIDQRRRKAALGASRLFSSRGAGARRAPWTDSPQQFDARTGADQKLRMLWRLWSYRTFVSDHRAAMNIADHFRLVSLECGPRELAIANRLLGVTLHGMGDQGGSRRCLESMLDSYDGSASRLDINRFQFDQRVSARSIMARVLWLQGFPDQAVRAVREAVETARELNHSMSLCIALANGACPVYLYVGDNAGAERAVATLSDPAVNGGVQLYQAWARGFQSVVEMRRGDLAVEGVRSMRDWLHRFPYPLNYTALLGEVSENLGRLGLTGEGLESIGDALEHAERTGENWCVAELLRVKADLVLREAAPSAIAVAEGLFNQSLDWARQQGALSWNLRTSISYAHFLRDQGLASEARDVLAGPYGRFSEGFGTADLRHANELLGALG